MSASQTQPRRERVQRTDIGDILLRTTNLTEEQLETARREQAESGGTLAERLVATGRVTADEVMTALSAATRVPSWPESISSVSLAAAASASPKMAAWR